MLARNSESLRDSFALALVKDHGLTLRDLQAAMDRSAAEDLALDLALADLKMLPSLTIAQAAETAKYVITAEQPGKLEVSKEGSRAGVILTVKFSDWNSLKVAYANNISRGTLGVTVPLKPEAPQVGASLPLVLSFPDGQILGVRGRVCYRRDSEKLQHIGVQVHHTHTEELRAIAKRLKSAA